MPTNREAVHSGCRQRFPKSARLKRAGDFQTIFAKGTSIRESGIEVRYLRNANLKLSRLGIVVKKRVFKRASKRNRLKRLAREFFRAKRARLKGPYEVIIHFKTQESGLRGGRNISHMLGTLFKNARLL